MIFPIILTVVSAVVLTRLFRNTNRLELLNIDRQNFAKAIFETQGTSMTAEARATLEALSVTLDHRHSDRMRVLRRVQIVGTGIVVSLTIISWWLAIRA